MSRVRIAILLIALSAPAVAQTSVDDKAAAMIAKAKQLTAIDGNGCLRAEEEDIIVVCGEGEDNKSQRIFTERRADEDRIRRGEASATRGVNCIGDYPQCAHRLHKLVGTGFGKVPPPATPLEEVYRGLPEPDMVVPEGSGGQGGG